MKWNPKFLKNFAENSIAEYPPKLRNQAKNLFEGAVKDIHGIHSTFSLLAHNNRIYLELHNGHYVSNLIGLAKARVAIESNIITMQGELGEIFWGMSSFYEDTLECWKKFYNRIEKIAEYIQENRFRNYKEEELLANLNSNRFELSIFPEVFIKNLKYGIKHHTRYHILKPNDLSDLIDRASFQ